jgi:hypothetical protein
MITVIMDNLSCERILQVSKLVDGLQQWMLGHTQIVISDTIFDLNF